MKSFKGALSLIKAGMTRTEKRRIVIGRLIKEGYKSKEICTLTGLSMAVVDHAKRDLRMIADQKKLMNEPAIKRLREELA